MSPNRPRLALSRAATVALTIALSVTALGVSGCKFFGKKDHYAKSAEARPLDFPPPFDPAEAERSEAAVVGGSVSRSSLGGGPAATSRALAFTVPGDRAAVYARVGELLASTPGLTIASRAQLLGAYDVDYEGQKFLVRVSDSGTGTQVSAVDPRGVPADNDAASKLIVALRAALVGN